MDKQNILSFLSINKSEFQNRFGIDDMALFGSFAKDMATKESDIDILITYVPNPGDVYTKKRDFRKLLEDNFHRKVDIANKKCLKAFVKDEILRDAIYVK
jgi:hypothetical protein